jgi:single-strand DNA-binding protein
MNKCIFLGRLTKDPEARVTANSQTPVANFTLAVNRKFKQEGQPTADFLNFVAFGKVAEIITKYVKKGNQITVVSRVQVRSWDDQDGKKHYATEFVIDEFDFAEGKKADGDTGNSGGFKSVEEENDSSDDLPF